MRIFSQGWSDNKDGPGIRYVIYLKGCNFNCCYCGNPESISPEFEIMHYQDRASQIPLEKCCSNKLDCKNCTTFECAKIFRHKQMEVAGENLSISRIMEKIKTMRHLIDGVTLGGGEPTLQIDEVLELLTELKQNSIHTAIESNASTENYKKILGKVDYLISDLKAGTSETYKAITGVEAGSVRANLRKAAELQKDFLIRIPLITDYNTGNNELLEMRKFLGELLKIRGELQVQTLRLHHAGSVKYRALKKPYLLENTQVPTMEFQKSFEDDLKKDGIKVLSYN